VAPTEGIAAMREARIERAQVRRRAPSAGEAARIARLPAERLASGPGLVCAAFGIDRSLTGTDLCRPDAALRLEAAVTQLPIATTARIGVAYAGQPWTTKAWRFVVPGDPSASGPTDRPVPSPSG
jgi:3-methyladenine DNA glycosylase Mpg